MGSSLKRSESADPGVWDLSSFYLDFIVSEEADIFRTVSSAPESMNDCRCDGMDKQSRGWTSGPSCGSSELLLSASVFEGSGFRLQALNIVHGYEHRLW